LSFGQELKVVQERFKLETEGLIRSWMRYEQKTLRDYLVQDVEDPCINIQSILTRHFLIERLFGQRFATVMEQELRFGLVVNWLLKLLETSNHAGQLHAVLDALLEGRNNTEDVAIPQYVSETFSTLTLPNYICDLFTWAPVETTDAPIPEYLMETFQKIWCEMLDSEWHRPISVLEPACGSANDYCFIDAFGIGRFLDYTGFDLCEKNILDAKRMFPDICFQMDNVLKINAPDKTFDYCFVHDLFEHLSAEAMIIAISEICRVTRKEICVGFFNMYDGDQHVVKSINDYHWNKLSMGRTKTIFEQYAFAVQVIHIDSFLLSRFGCGDTHNKGAYTFIVRL